MYSTQVSEDRRAGCDFRQKTFCLFKWKASFVRRIITYKRRGGDEMNFVI